MFTHSFILSLINHLLVNSPVLVEPVLCANTILDPRGTEIKDEAAIPWRIFLLSGGPGG